MPTDKEFAQRLRTARQTAGLTQVQLGKRAEINDKQISHYETGIATPELANLRKLAKALNVSFDWLTGESDEQ